jgi:hypothetical protein
MKNESESSTPNRSGEAWTRNVSSFNGGELLVSVGDLGLAPEAFDCALSPQDVCLCPCILDRRSIFSSFSSSKSFNSRTSVSRALTRSSSDSVYPRGNARRLNLSLVRHSKPTLAHWEHVGRVPSQRIFLLRHRSQAWAIRLWALLPTLITFIGRMPGMVGEGGRGLAKHKCREELSLLFVRGVEDVVVRVSLYQRARTVRVCLGRLSSSQHRR